MSRACTCPPDGSRYCPRCQALLDRLKDTAAGYAASMRLLAWQAYGMRPDGTIGPIPPKTLAPFSDRYRSKTERRFAEEVAEPMKRDGKIEDWWYEPCKGLYLAPKTSYTPDFLFDYLRFNMPSLVFIEVKGGFIRPQDWIKAKTAARLYPCFGFKLAQWKGGTWHWKEIPGV